MRNKIIIFMFSLIVLCIPCFASNPDLEEYLDGNYPNAYWVCEDRSDRTGFDPPMSDKIYIIGPNTVYASGYFAYAKEITVYKDKTFSTMGNWTLTTAEFGDKWTTNSSTFADSVVKSGSTINYSSILPPLTVPTTPPAPVVEDLTGLIQMIVSSAQQILMVGIIVLSLLVLVVCLIRLLHSLIR